MAKDGALEFGQLGARLDPQVLDQSPSGGPVCLQRLGLAAGAVEGEHEGAPQALPQRMLAHQGAELADQLGGTAEGEVGLEAALEGRQPLLFQAGGCRLGEGLEGQVGEGGPAPQRQPPAEGLRRRGRVSRRHGPAGPLDQGLEAVQVELVGIEPEQVAGGSRHQPPASLLRGPQQPPQPRDVHLDDLPGRRRRLLAPEAVGQPVRRDGLVAVQQQQGEQRALLWPAQGEGALTDARLERPKDQELHVPAPVYRRVRDHRTPASRSDDSAVCRDVAARSALLGMVNPAAFMAIATGLQSWAARASHDS